MQAKKLNLRTTRNSRGIRAPRTPPCHSSRKVTFDLEPKAAPATFRKFKATVPSPIKKSNTNRTIINKCRQLRNLIQRGLTPARRLRAIQEREGERFARGLYIAIINDHLMRGCECGIPEIYENEWEAKHGQGRLRFYKFPRDNAPRDIGVLTATWDPNWHCHCTAERDPTYAPIIGKRSADDAELEEIDRHLEEAADRERRERESKDEQLSRHKTKRQRIEGAFHTATKGLANMSRAVFRATFDVVGKTFSAITGTYSSIVENIQHARQHGLEPAPPTVQRLKRQICLPAGVSPEITLDQDITYRWANTDFCQHIGRDLLDQICTSLKEQWRRLEADMAAWRRTTDDLRKIFTPPKAHVDLNLSIAVHNLMMDHYSESSYENFLKAVEDYKGGIKNSLVFIEWFYLNEEIYNCLLEAYPTPPMSIEYRRYADSERMMMQQGGDFLAWLIKQKEAYTLNPEGELGLAKIIVDINAVNKNEIAPSMVDYNGQKDLLIGSLPEQLIYDEIPIHSLSIQPSYAEKFPDSEDDSDKAAPAGPRFRPMAKPKSILKKDSREWPKNQTSTAYVSTPPKKRKLTFDSPVAAFEHPTHIPPFHHGFKPSIKTGILKEPNEYPLKPASPEDAATPMKQRAVEFSNMKDGTHEFERHQFPKRKAKLIPFGTKAWRKEIRDDDQYALRKYDEKFGRLLDHMTKDIRQEPNAPDVEDHVTKVPQPASCTAERCIPFDELFPYDEDEPQGRIEQTGRKPKVEMGRQFHMDLFFHDMKLTDDNRVVYRDPQHLRVEFEAEVDALTQGMEDMMKSQVRSDHFAEKDDKRVFFQAQVDAAIRQKEIEEEEARRKVQQEKERREREEREYLEHLEQERARREAEERRAREAEEMAQLRALKKPQQPMIEPLDDDWDAKVDAISTRAENVVQAKTLEGTGLTKRDFDMLLHPHGWLNDNSIIGGVMAVAEYVNKTAGVPAGSPKCVAFNSFFYNRLVSHGPNSLNRLMKRNSVAKANFLSIETILVPICAGQHWTLAVVRPSLRTIGHIDSMLAGGGSESVTTSLHAWVKATLGDLFVEEDWRTIQYECPRQTNGWDCGVFTITNAMCLALGLEPTASYSARQLTLQRRRIAAVFLNDGFAGDFSLDRLVEG